MSRAAQSTRWDHTSHVLSQTYNIHRGKNQSARPPRDFHPLAESRRRSRGMTVSQLHAMRDSFPNQITLNT
jgi:hypothetical protein